MTFWNTIITTVVGTAIGALILSLMIRNTITQSEKDGWIGHGDNVYRFEFLCDRNDIECLKKYHIDTGPYTRINRP